MTPRRKRRERLSAAIDALAAAVPYGALMAATDPADFLLEVRVRLATAADTESRLRDEIRDLRLQVQELTEDLEDARRHGCECGEEEACRYVRERDKARALADTYREELRLAEAETARLREALERIAEARARLGVGAGRPRPVLGELSAEAKAARAPLRPEELVEAQHDRVHRDPGRTRAARTVRNSRRGTT